MKKIFLLLIPIFIVSIFSAQAQEKNPWAVPDNYKEMINPLESNKKSISDGKKLYKQHCKLCHGKTGEGDGYHAKNLQVDPSKLSFDDIDTQNDGELFYKIKTGRDEMHSFKVVLVENDIWNLVNYIRTLHEK